MTKLFVYLDNVEYSEGENTFYIAADSLNDAANVFKSFVFSHDYWGDNIPSEHVIYKQLKKLLSGIVIKECHGIYVDDSRKNHKFYELYDSKYDWYEKS